MEKMNYNIVSSKLFIRKVILSNLYGALAFLSVILGFSTGSSESILVSLGAPFWMNLVCAVAILVSLALSIKYYNIKPILGELYFNGDHIVVRLSKSQDTKILYKDITSIELYLNNKKDKMKYSRGFFDGYNNWIIINNQEFTVFEFHLRSIKMEDVLVHFLREQFKEKVSVKKQNKHILLSSNWYKEVIQS